MAHQCLLPIIVSQDKKPKKQATGPITAEGKSRSSMNAVRHGALSSKVLLPSECAQDFELLMRDLIFDLRPVGAIENILVEKIVGAVWRKRRWEGAEQDAISSVQMKAITDDELKSALGLHITILPDWMVEKNIPGIEWMKALPIWMLDENNAPNEADGIQATRICDEWAKFKEKYVEAETEQHARRDFPAHWACLKAEMKESGYRVALDYLEEFYRAQGFYQGFSTFMTEQQPKYYWIAYWHENREKISTAFRAIRVKKMLGEWDSDRSHRYHTMLDGQLFKLLREFREVRES